MKECGSWVEEQCDECDSTDDCEDYCSCRCLDNYVSDWMKEEPEERISEAWRRVCEVCNKKIYEHPYEQQPKGCSKEESKIECGRCMDIVPSINADGMCDGCVEETNDAELMEESK